MHQVFGLWEAIFEGGISQVLKKHVFTAMLAQHVACSIGVRGLVQVPNPRLAVYYYSASSLINYITGV